MADWKESAKQSLENRKSNITTPVVSTPKDSSVTKAPTTGTTSSGSWKEQLKRSLDSRGYIPPEKRSYELKLNDGKNFGVVSYDAYKAITNNQLEGYTPKSESEKQALESYKEWNKQNFSKNSTYKSTKNGKEKHLIPGTTYYDETGYDDIEHDYINGNEEAIGIVNTNEATSSKFILGTDSQFLKTMTPDEKATYNYIYNVEGKEAGKKYLKDISSDLNLRQRLKSETELAEYAKDNKWKMSAATIILSPMKVVSAIGQVNDYLDDGKIDQNAGYNKYVYNTNAVRQSVSEEIEKGATGKLGSFVYNTGMSIGDSVMNTIASGGNKFLSLGTMGIGAFANTVVSAKDRGLSDNQAMGLGVVSAIAEIFTESFSWDKLFGAKNIGEGLFNGAEKGVKSYILDNIKTNALEEMGADAINFAADVFISKDKSEWQDSVNKYIKDGYSESKAWALTFKDTATQFALSGLAGALSGATMSGSTGIMINSHIKSVGEANSNNVLGIIGDGLSYDKNSEAYKHALKLSKSNGEITDYDIGRQVLLNDVQKINTTIGEGLKQDKNSEAYKNAKRLQKSDNVTSEDLEYQNLLNKGEKTISVGDSFADSKYHISIKVVGQNKGNTTIETTNLATGKTETKSLPSSMVNSMLLSDRYTKLETPSTTDVVEETANVESATTPQESKTNGQLEKVESAENTDIAETPTETTDVSSRKNINLKRIGKFYEVYGEDAMLLAEELDGVETTKAVVNGVETDVLRLPANLVEGNADAVSDEYNLVLSDKPKAENQPITNETTTTDETIPSAEENATESEISLVVNAMNDTFKPKAKEDLKNSDLKGDVEKFAELVSNFYKAHKTLSSFADYFTDKGAKVISAIEGKTDTVENTSKVETDNKTDVVSVIGETLTPQAKENLQDGDANENYNSMAETLIEVYKEDGTLEAFADFFTDGGKKVEAAIKEKIDNSDVADVLKNESESDTIESKSETTPVESEDNGNERSKRTVEERTVHNDGNVERTDGERTGRSSERVSGKTGNAQKTETERTTRKKVATVTFDEVKRDYYTPKMESLEKGTYDKYGVVVKYFYGKCIDDSGAKGNAFYYKGVLYIRADDETSLESRIDHEITHHFGKSNAMTEFRNAVKAKMPKAEYDSWYAEIKEAYGDVLMRYLSEELKNSNYTLTDAELQQLMDEYIEEEMLANLNGEQVPFATEYRAEIEAFRKEIGNYNTKNTKSKATSESKTRNIPAEYSESIDAGGEERYSLFPGGVFPPYNKSHSDANERATRWAHNDDIETGAQRIFFYKGSPYLVEKFDSMDLGYLVMRKLSKREAKALDRYDKFEDGEIENGENYGEQRRGNGTLPNSKKHQEGIENTQRSGIHNYSSDKHNGEIAEVQGMDREQDGKRSSERNGSRDNKRSVEDREEVRLSLKDSKGNTLTEAQQEYFKDSKVRDENGNLLVMYQGASGDFTVFDRKKSSYANLYGRGFYFTKSERHASLYGNTRAYYLNIKNPVSTTETTITKAQLRKFLEVVTENEDYSFENYGYGATVDSVLQSTYGKSDFLMLNDVSQTAIGDLVEAVELFNEVNGTDYDGIVLYTETVTFNSEQAKLTSNEKPTSNPDIRFSLTEPVEETKNLVAVHNLSSEKLLKTLKLGGLPMPSIAITRAREGYNNFGEISLVFGKETIDPKFFRSNKVYSGDAWTPTYPHIDYKVNEKATEKIREKINALVPKKIQNDLGGLHLDSYNVEDALNRNGDMVNHYRYNYAMKYAFLKDKGIDIELPTIDEPLYSYGEVSNDAVISFAHKMVDGLKSVNSLLEQHSSKLMEDTELINGITSVLNEEVISTADKNTDAYQKLVENPVFKPENIDLSTVLGMLEAARKYFNANGKIANKIDYKEARNLIDEKTDVAKYESWLKDLFNGIVAKEGIRNNKDLFTPSGNRRSFEALHYEHTLENVIKAMKEEGTKGIGGFGGGNIFGAATQEYGSVDDIKADAENRMQQLPESKYDEIKKGFSDRLFELANSLPIHKDSFTAVDDAANMLIEAVMKFKTKSGMANYLRSESKGWANYKDYIVDDLIALVNDIRKMPVSYFEAKPQRAVGFDEIKAVIMPEQSSYEDDLSEVKAELEKLGIPILEYEYGDNNARIKALNSLDDVRFSLSNENKLETQKKIEKMAKEVTSHEDFIELTKQNTKEFVDKIKENESLQKRLKNAKRQMLLSPKPSVNIAKVGKVTKDILAEMDSTLKATDLKDRVTSIYNEYFADIKKAAGVESKTQEANDNMMKRFAELAVDIADSAEVYTESEEYGLLKSYLKDVRIRLPESAKSDAHYAEFRKSHMGTFNLTNDGLEMDVVYQELCEMFPGMFDESITHPADQLYAIADTLEGLKPYAYNPHLEYMQDAIDHIVYRFASEVDGLAAMPKTKAQKIAEKGAYDKEMALEKERASFERKLDKHKKNSEKTIQALQKKIGDSEYVRYWEKRLSKEEKAQAVKEVRDKRDIAILKTKIRNLVSDMKKKLDKTEKNGGYPKELVQAVADVCSVIDFHTDRTNKDGSPTKASLKLDALKMQYDALKNSPNYDFQSEHSEEISNKILELHQKVQNKRVVDLTITELTELKNILSAINHSLSIASKQIGIENAKENLEIATEIINSLKLDKKAISEIRNQLLKEMKLAKESGKAFIINPHRVFEMIANYDRNSAWWQLYDQILRGSRNVSKFTMDATMPFDELTDGGGNEIAFYDFRTKKVKTGIKYVDGTDVEIPKSIICELVMLWDRKQGRNHLEFGGVKIPDLQLFNKGKTADALAAGKMTNAITQADITRLKGMLDSYDKAWIERSRYLFNKVAKDAINETSMQLVGREVAKADNYIRIYVDSDFVKKDIGKDEGEITIEGHGSLKETTPDAKNPVVLRGLHENVYEHIDFASKYYGLAIPIRNFNKVYKMSINDNGNLDSVKNILGSVFGPRIRDGVVVRAIKDLQSPRHRELSVFNKVKGKWLTATFWANIRSMLKQTTSYWTSSSILDESSLVKGLVSYAAHRKQTKAEISKYSGTLYKRSQGLSTTELGDRANRKRLAGLSSKTTKFINENLPALRNIPEWIRPGNWLQSMDVAVSSALWDACKHQVSKTMNVSDDGYMKAVADLYERVIEETQSNYDVLHRPEILKSTNPLNQTLGMFQTDNLQQTGIMYSAFSDLQAKHKAYKSEPSAANEQNLKDAKKRMDKAIRSRIYSSLWMALVIPLGDALLRKFKPYIDDEEKEITSRSFLKQMMLNMCEDMFGVFVPVVGQLGTKALGTFNDGYDFMNDPAFDVLEDFIKATSKIHKAYEEDGDVLKAWTDAIPAISNMTGIPAKNISDLYKAAKGYMGDIKAGEFAHDLEDYTSGNKSFYDYGDLASYIVSGNTEKETKWKDYYSANGKEFAKGSLTKEIKPTYVQMYVDFPERAYSLKKKLILDYDYIEADINEWIYDEYLKHIVPGKKFADKTVSNPEYAIEIRTFAKQNNTWNTSTALKNIQSKYKEVYKKEAKKGEDRTESSALRKALLDDGVVSTSSFTQWEREVDNGINQEKIKLDAEKNKFKD